MVTVEQALGGNVKVTIEVAREALVFVWKMSEAQAREEAEEIVRRLTH